MCSGGNRGRCTWKKKFNFLEEAGYSRNSRMKEEIRFGQQDVLEFSVRATAEMSLEKR